MNEPVFSQFISLAKSIPGLDVKYAVEAMGGSEALYEKTLMHTVRHIPSNVEEMDASLHANSDLEAFGIKVHGIKSALRHVGKMELARKAESLENAAKGKDKMYCIGHYVSFKDELLRFYSRVNDVSRQCAGPETDTGAESVTKGDINSFIDVIKQAQKAADLCDSMSAYEILLPLTKMRFGGACDNLISKAATALDKFEPFEAMEYITELLNECKYHNHDNERGKSDERREQEDIDS